MAYNKDGAEIIRTVVKAMYEIADSSPVVTLSPVCNALASIDPLDTRVVMQMLNFKHLIKIYWLFPLTEAGTLVEGEDLSCRIRILPGFKNYAYKKINGEEKQSSGKYYQEDAIEFCKNWIHAGNNGREAHRWVHRDQFPLSSAKEADRVFKKANERLGRRPGRPSNAPKS